MATVSWIGNANNIAQVVTGTVTTVANGALLTATMSTKTITYTCTASDTTTTAAAGLAALLPPTSSAAAAEFGVASFTSSGAVITATESTAGEPFAGMTGGLVFAASGGAAITQATSQANVSQSDVNDVNNWIRSGVNAIPVNGDDMVVMNTDVPLRWNLTALASVQLNSFTRYQSFIGTIGLPDINPLGFVEFRPTYFQFAGAAASLPITLGLGSGQGPTRERYNVGSSKCVLNVVASGAASDEFAVRFLGTNANNTATILGTSVGVAYWAGETSTLASALVDGGGSMTIGSGTTFSGTLTVQNGSVTLYATAAAIVASNNSQVTVITLGTQVSGTVSTYASVTAIGQSTITWNSNATITTLTLTTGSFFDKSQDARAMTITNSTIDGDTCQANDPNSAITWTNATSVKNLVSSGPFIFNGTRTVKVT